MHKQWFELEGPSSIQSLSAKHVLLLFAYIAIEGITDILETQRYVANSIHPGLIDPEFQTWRSKQLMDRLFKQEYLKRVETPHGKQTVMITKRGMRRALTYNLEAMKLIKPKVWDRKWRVVLFDIPVRYGKIRHIFRLRLVQLGLLKLQESVYVSPYPCFDEIEFLRELYEVSFTVRYLLVEKIEEDGYLREHFHLEQLVSAYAH